MTLLCEGSSNTVISKDISNSKMRKMENDILQLADGHTKQNLT
jgi:hypothetical protein